MPALAPADTDFTLEPPNLHSNHPGPRLLLSHGIFVTLAAAAIFVLLRFAHPPLAQCWSRFRRQRRRGSGRRGDQKDYGRDLLARPGGSAAGITGGVRAWAQGLRQQPIRLTESGSGAVLARQLSPTDHDMDRSRGVSGNWSSNSAADLSQRQPPRASGPFALKSSSSSSSSPSPVPHTGTDGAASARKEKSIMDGDSWLDIAAAGPGTLFSGEPEPHSSFGGAGSGAAAAGMDFTSAPGPPFMARPPPPPPLTPPTLSTAIFTFEDRRPSYAHSIPPELDTVSPASFIHQPNPDYHHTGSSSSTDVQSPPSPTIPKRRSYTKTVPINIPAATRSAASTTLEDGATAHATAVDPLLPSSFPPTAPLLPPPPPGHHDVMFNGDAGGMPTREIDVQGEIISVLDESGAGWKRHTRVYGGGVCLACLAAGGCGGFYGDRVRPEDRR